MDKSVSKHVLERQLIGLMHFVITRNKYSKVPLGYESKLCPMMNQKLFKVLVAIANHHFCVSNSDQFTRRIYSLVKFKDNDQPIEPNHKVPGSDGPHGNLRIDMNILRTLLQEFIKEPCIVDRVFQTVEKHTSKITTNATLINILLDYFAFYYCITQYKFSGITGVFFPPVTASMLYLLVEMICHYDHFLSLYDDFKKTWPNNYLFHYFNNAFVEVGLYYSTTQEKVSNTEYASLISQSQVLEYINPTKHPAKSHLLNIEIYKNEMVKWILGEGPFSMRMLTSPNNLQNANVKEPELVKLVGNPDQTILKHISQEKIATLGFRKDRKYQYAGKTFYDEMLK